MDTQNTREGMADIDEIDLALLKYIESDFDVSLKQLSEELDLSKSAVHYRLDKLRKSGVIKGTTADIDPLALGLNMLMITNISVAHETGYVEDIGPQLAEIDGVQQVYYTMGEVDFVVMSRVQTREQMNELIDAIVAIEGVNETSSTFVMKEVKTDGQVVATMSEMMRENALDSSR